MYVIGPEKRRTSLNLHGPTVAVKQSSSAISFSPSSSARSIFHSNNNNGSSNSSSSGGKYLYFRLFIFGFPVGVGNGGKHRVRIYAITFASDPGVIVSFADQTYVWQRFNLSCVSHNFLYLLFIINTYCYYTYREKRDSKDLLEIFNFFPYVPVYFFTYINVYLPWCCFFRFSFAVEKVVDILFVFLFSLFSPVSQRILPS